MKNFLFLTSSNLATNPRLYKEIQVALDLNYKVHVVMFRLGNWSDDRTEQLITNLDNRSQLQLHYLNTVGGSKLSWLLWGLLEKIAKKIYPIFNQNLMINSLASNRRSIQLWWYLKNNPIKPDIIIGHNLPALYPSFKFSMKIKTPFIFDVEDYHPGEGVAVDADKEIMRRKFLMASMLPHAQLITSASPLIEQYTLRLVEKIKNSKVILNSFKESEFLEPDKESDEILKLVWFSQNISYGRGLEQLIKALEKIVKDKHGQKFQLILIGAMNQSFYHEVIEPFKKVCSNYNLQDFVVILDPMLQNDLHLNLSNYDVGLALEFDSSDLNRQLCLTNKILTYAQAGLYIMATNTKAQIEFLEKHDNLGVVCGQNVEDITKTLLYLLEIPLQESSKQRYLYAKKLSWENESEILKQLWKKFI